MTLAKTFHAPFLLAITIALALAGSLPLEQPIGKLGETTVSIFPPSILAAVGQDFSIDVSISAVVDLYGWEFTIAWDPELLDATSASEGPFLRSGGSTFFYYNINASAGHIIADCTLLGPVSGVTGDGVLSTVTFHVKDIGQSVLDLDGVVLLNSLEQKIQCQAVDGYAVLTAAHDIAVLSASTSATSAPPGIGIEINVTVENQGGYLERFNVSVYANSTLVDRQYVQLAGGLSVVLQLYWDTSEFQKGEYAILACASLVPGESDIADNNKQATNMITILSIGHDVAVTSVKPIKTAVGQGYAAEVDVTVKNYGTFSETFSVITYANMTVIGVQVATVNSGSSVVLRFVWDTSNSAKGKYAIRAQAPNVPNETDTTDNALIGNEIMITIPGDVNNDKNVNVLDLIVIAGHIGHKDGDGHTMYTTDWYKCMNADINNDKVANVLDLIVCANHIGQNWS